MTWTARLIISAGVTLSLALSGCARKEDPKVAELQKQLDEANKKLEEAKRPEAPAPAPATGAAPAAAVAGAGKVGPRARTGSGKTGEASSALSRQVDANKTALEQNRMAIESNRAAIEQNKQGLAANKEAAAKAQATADEAKRAAIRPMHTFPVGYAIKVRTSSEISTKTAASGSQWEGTLDEDMVIDGYVVAPKGSTVEGTVSNSDPGGRVKGVASIAVKLTRILTPEGQAISVRTGEETATAKSSKGKDALKTGIGAGIGAAIGAIAGGGKGAAIGAGAGAAGGIGVAMATRGDAASIPAESVLTFALSSAVTVEERKQR